MISYSWSVNIWVWSMGRWCIERVGISWIKSGGVVGKCWIVNVGKIWVCIKSVIVWELLKILLRIGYV